MTRFTVCKWRRALPKSASSRLCDDPATWLPQPLLFTGVREFTITLELGRVCLTTDATLSGPWRRGRTVSRTPGVGPCDVRGRSLMGAFHAVFTRS